MSQSVLVPLDGSPLSLDALRHALTTFPNARITVLHVVDLFEPGYGTHDDVEASYEPLMGSDEWYERAGEHTDRIFEEARLLADDLDREIRTASEIGDPQRVIVAFAEEEDVDHVVLGAHGREETDRGVYGITAELVASRAPVTVTLVR
jgi:nucleotide-binding universal stress UspA family protein